MTILQGLLALFKNKNIELTGQWSGHYGYGKQYSHIIQNRIVTFVADITAHNTILTGSIREDETGIPEISKIEGTLKNGRIQFSKTYQNRYSIDENGIRMAENGPHYVQYSGKYYESKSKFSGTWTIETLYTFDDGRKRKYISSGHWEMKRSIPLHT